MNKYWQLVFLCVIFEVCWVMGLKHADSTIAWIGTIIAILISFTGLLFASTKLPVGTVYAVFVGLGTAGTVIVEMVLFGEPFQFMKVALIAVLLIGVLGLKLLTPEPEQEAK